MPPDHREVEYKEAIRAFYATEPQIKQLRNKKISSKKSVTLDLCNSEYKRQLAICHLW